MVVGAHLDAGCGTSSVPTSLSYVQDSSCGLRGGSGSSSSKGKGLISSATSGIKYVGSEDDEDVPIAQLTGANRKRSRQTVGGACARVGTDTITISDDSDDSSGEDEIGITDAQEGLAQVKGERGVAELSDDDGGQLIGTLCASFYEIL